MYYCPADLALLAEEVARDRAWSNPVELDANIGCVYLVARVGTTQAKIGRSRNLETRVAHLRAKSRQQLALLWTTPGDCRLEGELHWHFRDLALGKEWFDFGDLDPIEAVSAASAMIPIAWQDSMRRNWPTEERRLAAASTKQQVRRRQMELKRAIWRRDEELLQLVQAGTSLENLANIDDHMFGGPDFLPRPLRTPISWYLEEGQIKWRQ